MSLEPPTVISFGSCNRQYLDQPIWKHIKKLNSELWLWTGDSVYAKSPGGITEVLEAYEEQLTSTQYIDFLSSGVKVDGVFDDHDWGVNDAGSELDAKRQRMDAFLNFIGASNNDSRRFQDALYKAIILGPIGKNVKAVLRMISGLFCIGREYEGDLLGSKQWEWFENEIKQDDAMFHVIVSTIQVLTSNPIVESWGHFPHSKRKLLSLLEKYKPRGTMLVSGDVHFAEFLSGNFNENVTHHNDNRFQLFKPELMMQRFTSNLPPSGSVKHDAVLEVTSSGLTHSCLSKYGRGICNQMLKIWGSYRSSEGSYHLGENFGSMIFNWESVCEHHCEGHCNDFATFNVHNLDGNIVLSTNRSSCERWNIGYDRLIRMESVLNNKECYRNRTVLAILAIVALGLLFKKVFPKKKMEIKKM